MTTTAWLLTALLCAAVSLTSVVVHCQSSSVIEDGMRRYMEQFRLDMECGWPEMGVPVLAPLRHVRLPVNINLNEFAFQGNLINFHSGDLNSFIVRNTAFNLVMMRIDYHIHFPHLTTTGQFRQGIGRSPGNCAIHGGGQFAVRANGVDCHMSIRLALRSGTLQIGEMTSRVTMQSFQSNIQSFVGTQQQNAACNLQLQNAMPRLFVQQQAHISRYLDGLLRPGANDFVSGMTLQDLVQIITAPVGPPQPCWRRMVGN